MTRRDAASRSDLRARLQVLRCQAGDETAFADLYRAYSPGVRRYISGFVGAEATDDVLQDVWITVFRRIREVTNPGGFRTWLFRTARHRAIDARRAEKRRFRLARQAFAEIEGPVSGGAELPTTDVEALGPALATLTADHREVVQLRFFEDLTYADIAVITGCPIGTVRSRIHNAKAKLRTVLDGREAEADNPSRRGNT